MCESEMASIAPPGAKQRIFEMFLLALLVLAGAHAAYVLILGLNKPLLDLHSFRQTQTAISVWRIMQGGPWLAYETPVLGAP